MPITDLIGELRHWSDMVKLLSRTAKYSRGYNNAVKQKQLTEQRLRLYAAASPTAQLCAVAQIINGDKK